MDKRPFDPQEVVEQIARGEIACGDFELRIDRDGRWHYRGTPIERARLVRLFSTALHRAADGTYWLVTPIERGRVQVDDAPFVAVEMRVSGEGSERAIDFRTNIEEWLPLGEGHALTMRPSAPGTGNVPYLDVRRSLEARVATSVFYELAELAEAEGEDLGVWSRGRFFTLEAGGAGLDAG